MPEGHTIHRLARLHRRALVGRRIEVSSPQGRFADGAALLDGRLLREIEAHGKHLFYRWDDIPHVLHVHLGLIGTFRTVRGSASAPSPTTRLRLSTKQTSVDLTGPMTCALITDADEQRIRERLGPDPLRRDADPEQMWDALRRRRTPVGAALLDQRTVAGIGNVYRAEALFVCELDPRRGSATLSREEVAGLWSALRRMLRAGERSGRIVTVDPQEVGARSLADVPDAERTYVYRRTGQPCRRCSEPIAALPVGGRPLYLCPRCQHVGSEG